MKPKIIIIMDGGILQNILSDTDIDISAVDYDIDGIEEDLLTKIPYMFHGKEDFEYAYCNLWNPDIDVKKVERLHKIISTDLNQKGKDNED